VLQRLAPLAQAGPDALSFLINPTYLPDYRRTRAGAVLVAANLADGGAGGITRIVVAEPHRALSLAAQAFSPTAAPAPGIDSAARVAVSARLGADCRIGPFVVVGEGAVLGARVRAEAGSWIGDGVVLGDDCVLGPNAVCYPGARLGDRVVLKAGAVIGGPGFGYVREGGEHRRLPHLGACVLEDDVEIGSGSCVDRGSFDDTVIGRGTKIDNLVQVGHNVRLGIGCLVMATSGIAGSCRIGDGVVIAGGVGIADHVTIGDGAVIGAKSVVFGPGQVEPGAVVTGFPARPHRAFLRAQAALYRLPPLVDELEALVAERRGAADPRAAG